MPKDSDQGLIIRASGAPPFTGGDGSTSNPFQITNVSQLQNMSADLSAHYVLINDIDASETKSWNSGLGFSPIANDTNLDFEDFNGTGFTGSLDGRGYNIIGLFINRPTEAYIGLFGQINSSAIVKNVNLRNANMTGNHSIAGLLGKNDGGSVINFSVTGNVYGNYYLGGLMGRNGQDGFVMDCGSVCTIVGVEEYFGGLIGFNNGQVIDSHAHGNTNGDLVVGGLIGENGNTGFVRNCSATGNITGTFLYVGGLIGYNYGQVINCQAHGNSYGDMMVGGLVGENTLAGEIRDCFTNGDINGTGFYIGGIVGENYGSIMDCSASNQITGNGNYVGGVVGENLGSGIVSNCSSYSNVTGYSEVGGIIGTNYGTLANCSAYGNTSGDNSVGGLVGLNSGTINNCYSHSKIIGNDRVGGSIGDNSGGTVIMCYSIGFVAGTTDVGGFSGKNTGTIEHCFWDKQTSGQSTSAGGSGKYSAEMMTETTFTNEGWDFRDVWGLGGGATYPFFLKWYTPPIITTTDIATGKEGEFYYVNYDAQFSNYPANNDIDTWLVYTNAGNWLSIDENGVLFGRPSNAAVGEHWVNVTVRDLCKRINSHNFTLNVSNVNDAPIIITKELTNAIEDKLYNFKITAFDSDPTGDVMIWDMSSNATWLSINNTNGNLSGTPINKDVGNYWVNVTVNDGHNGTDWMYFTFDVINTNDDPFITTMDNKTIKFGEQYWVDYEAEDIDPTDDILTWLLNTNASWLVLDSENGILSGTPVSIEGGTYWVNVSVSDSKGGIDWHNFTLRVIPGEIEPNEKPVITTLDVTNGEVGKEYKVEYTATDDSTPEAELVWSMSSNASWLSFDPVTKLLSGIPNDTDFGSFWVNITVLDGDGGFTSSNFMITIPKPYMPPVNNIPRLSDGKMTPETGDTNTEFNFTVIYIDEDGEPPVFIQVVIDGFAYDMNLTSGTASDGIYEYKTKLSEGVHKYYFWATDGEDDCEPGDMTTPTNTSTAKTTSEITKLDIDDGAEDKNDDKNKDNSIVYFAALSIIIIIIVLVLLAIVLIRSKKELKSIQISSGAKPTTSDLKAQERIKPKPLVMDKPQDLRSKVSPSQHHRKDKAPVGIGVLLKKSDLIEQTHRKNKS